MWYRYLMLGQGRNVESILLLCIKSLRIDSNVLHEKRLAFSAHILIRRVRLELCFHEDSHLLCINIFYFPFELWYSSLLGFNSMPAVKACYSSYAAERKPLPNLGVFLRGVCSVLVELELLYWWNWCCGSVELMLFTHGILPGSLQVLLFIHDAIWKHFIFTLQSRRSV